MPEEQDEETAKEEGEEMKAVEWVFLVGELWRGNHVVGDVASCPEYKRRNEAIEAIEALTEYPRMIRVQDCEMFGWCQRAPSPSARAPIPSAHTDARNINYPSAPRRVKDIEYVNSFYIHLL